MSIDREASCRRCRVYCDWVVDPLGCLGCSRLYAYDAKDGRRYVGCVEGVHLAELELQVLEASVEEGRAFGGVRAARLPLPICSATVDPAYPQRLPEIGCVNPEFHEPPGGGTITISVRGASSASPSPDDA